MFVKMRRLGTHVAWCEHSSLIPFDAILVDWKAPGARCGGLSRRPVTISRSRRGHVCRRTIT